MDIPKSNMNIDDLLADDDYIQSRNSVKKLNYQSPQFNFNFSPQQQNNFQSYSQEMNQNTQNYDHDYQQTMLCRNQKQQNFDSPLKTKVLLICIFNKNATLVTHDILYRLFSQYGDVTKILIFEKSKMWKAFIEMDRIDLAERAKDGLNNYPIFEDGSKMNVYHSNMRQLQFQNNNSGGVDYSILKSKIKTQQQQQVSNSKTSSPQFSTASSSYAQDSPFLFSGGDNSINGNGDSNEFTNYFQTNSSSSSQSRTIADKQQFKIILTKYLTPPQTTPEQQHLSLNNYSEQEQQQQKQSSQKQQLESFSILQQKPFIFSPQHPLQQKQISQPVQLPQYQQIQQQQSQVQKGQLQQQTIQQQQQQPIQRSPIQQQPSLQQLQIQTLQPQSNNNITNNNKIQVQVASQQDTPESLQFNLLPPLQPLQNLQNNQATKQAQTPQIQPQTSSSSQQMSQPNEERKQFLMTTNQADDMDQNLEICKEEKKKLILSSLENTFQKDSNEKMEHSLQKIESLLDQKKNNIGNNIQNNSNVSTNIISSGGGNKNNNNNINNNNSATYSPIDPANYVNPLFIIENRKSKVVYIRGLEDQFITVQHLYNLFSNFGNIVKMIFLRVKRSCLIEYENVEYATNAKDFLNNKVFMNHFIRIFYSNYETINLKNIDYTQSEDIFIGDEQSNRFKKNKQMSINPPSQTLHISNLKKETCSEEVIFQLFSQYGKVEAVKLIMQQQKNMCLVKFFSIEEAMNTISQMHGHDILGRKIQISFTHSKIQ